MNPVAPSVQPTRLLDQVQVYVIFNYYSLKKRKIITFMGSFL